MPSIDAPFIQACRNQPSSRVPVWFMRQAGRSLPEYRAVRGTGSILEALRDPDLATEVTLQPVHRYGVDAAILFSDIVAPVAALGFGVEIRPGIGPVTPEPFRAEADLKRLRPLEPDEDCPWVAQAVRQVVAELGDVPLIGFAGAPFTVASYLIEGGPSRTMARTKSMMIAAPELWAELMDRLANIAVTSLRSQVEAGASAVQLFDSWVGTLSPDLYEQHVLPASSRIIAGIADLRVPCIHYGVGTGELLELMAKAGGDVVGLDWRVPLDEARRRLGPETAVQGNLDPAFCLAPWPAVEERARDVLSRNARQPGHIFNLGHGVLPETDPGILARLVELVHSAEPAIPTGRATEAPS